MAERDIFIAALQKEDPAQRRAFLDEACAGQPELRRQVEDLLRLHEAAGSFLEKPAAETAATGASPHAAEPAASGEAPGALIGPYQLLQQLGEGGMGAVWLAQQTEPVKRLVALKLIKAGMDSRQVIARFEAERQALALMDHANIARVLDAGATATGRPYFVMELVKGVPITRYCDEHRLTPRQRLELFIPVCQAIQHAHQKGVIHRDLKPSNVLVALCDGRPVPKVIDFGIAKAAGQQLTDKTLLTGFGAIVGTPEYMSPEQAEVNQLDIDTRSDIYSLGVLLYVLLAGSPPFTRQDLAKAGLLEMLRVIREEEPSRPSAKLSAAEGLPTLAANRGMEPAKLTKLVRGELDWIVMKALEKGRSRRYDTANAFALDVQRYLADEPVLACPPSAGYRLRKFARRNKRGLAVAGLVLAFLVILGVGAGWALRDREAREREVAQESTRKLARTEGGIHQAVERAGDSLGALHAALKKPGGVFELLNQPARWELFLKTAQAELTQARRLLAGAEGKLAADVTEALTRLEQRLAGDEADYRLVLRLEKIRLDRATWVKRDFDNPTAAAKYATAFADFGILTRDPEAAAARLAASPIKEHLVAALDDWAWAANWCRKNDVVVRVLAVARRAAPNEAWGNRLRQVELWRDHQALARLAAKAPTAELSPQLADLVARFLGSHPRLQVAWLRRAQAQHPTDFWLAFDVGNALSGNEPAEAAVWFRVALAIRPTNASAYLNLGIALRAQKQLPEAMAAFQKARDRDKNHALAHVGIGLVLADQKKFPESITACRKAIEIDPKLAEAHHNLANALSLLGKLDEAAAAFREAIQLDKQHAPAYAALGSVLRRQGKLADAVAECRKAIDIDPNYAQGHDELGCALCQQRKFDEAIAAFHKAIKLDRKDHLTWANLHDAYHAAQKLDDAIKAYQQAIKADQQAIKREPAHAIPYYFLGDALRTQKKLPEAIAAYQMAIGLKPEYVVAYGGLGDALSAVRKLDDAIAAYEKAIKLNPKYVPARCNLGAVLLEQRNHEAAAAVYQEAIKLDPKNAMLRYNLGLALKELRKLNGAAAAFREAINLDERDAQAYSALAQVLRFQRKFAESVTASHKAIKLDPNRPGLHSDLSTTLREQGKLGEAVTAAQWAIQIDPNYAPAYTVLGHAFRKQGKPAEAEAVYRKAIALDPKHPFAYDGLGNLLRDRKRLDEAVAAHRTAIALDRQSAPYHANLGNALLDQKELGEAVAAYRTAIALDPRFAPAYHGHGLALAAQKQLPQAAAALRKAIEFNPQDAKAHNNLGIVLAEQGELDEAVAAYREAIALQPKNAAAYYNLGVALRKQRSLPEAVAAFRKAIEFAPRHVHAHVELGIALAHQRKLDEAVAAYREAIELDPKNAFAYYNLGHALNQQKKLDEAIAAYRKAIELRPGYAQAHCNFGLILQQLGQFAQALEFLQKGHELGRRQPGWSNPSGLWVKECERLLALDRRVPEVLAGKAADPAEQLGLADLCLHYKKRYADAALLYGKAFAAEPGLAEGPNQFHRYNAARAAVLAAGGKGVGADRLDAAKKARLRGQARDWLAASLAVIGKFLADRAAAGREVEKGLQHWLNDPDLSGVRDAIELAELPEEERQRWMRLWSDVGDLVRRAGKN